ncbi:F0F1 ATP synthase subunit B' [Pseudotabrizicola alkalilacus]|uniref:ATP synthase subunit b n=1 Tax=Pseudotabrizicola alkalilacus TaxID=2305252 RepID=A0A411Z691_9RHOB|nr:F0F1 ATP synthase subunit B' [Pseudotabrizicola alkalilacus]RGP38547.1 F0F1 ATP synthase subunit B' [Pseudotabrizicola alkalilacus]
MATETLAEGVAHGGAAVSSCLGLNGSAIGMPQLCTDWMPNQIFWLLVALIAIYFFLSRIGLPRIGAVLAERQGTISNDIAAAEEMKLQAVAAERAYTDALAQARTDANKIVAEAKAEIQKDLDVALARADAEISAKSAESEGRIAEIRAGAMAAVSEVAKDTAQELVAALGGSRDARAVSAAVSARLKG